MMALPPIQENAFLKPNAVVRRHSIDADFYKSPTFDRQFTILSNNTFQSGETLKSALKTNYKEFDLRTRSKYDDSLKLKVNFSTTEKNAKLPSLDQRNLISSLNTRQLKTRSTQVSIKQNSSISSASLTTTLAARSVKLKDESEKEKKGRSSTSLKPSNQQSSKEYLAKKNYMNKNEKLRRSASHAGRLNYSTKSEKSKEKKSMKKEKFDDNDNNDDDENDEDYNFVADSQNISEVKKFVALVKRLHIDDGRTPLPDVFRERPKQPRLLANLSSEGQYALMKTYEDTIANEIIKLHPNLSIYIPRVLTSKFRKRTNLPKNLKFLSTRLENLSENNSETPISVASPIKPLNKQNSFSLNSLPTMPEDVNFIEHKLLMSQQLEIAQEILDLIRKNKGEYITSKNTNNNLDVLRAYAAYVKIWAKYFRLR